MDGEAADMAENCMELEPGEAADHAENGMDKGGEAAPDRAQNQVTQDESKPSTTTTEEPEDTFAEIHSYLTSTSAWESKLSPRARSGAAYIVEHRT